ncbi:hypothetical protein CJI59_17350 [Streptomyces sp. Alain-F2R5]|uniref:hypothetical protein n=1 Tax=Streptomyces mutabilis TaxID=67332 RepID=UPI000BC9B7A0|nr:hypothetical protein [Streptomyces sp. Alain-F2R5]PAN00390.1 hypothetical protein CJI59_17350 [Streptomyces sp. Alain-F2R5]
MRKTAAALAALGLAVLGVSATTTTAHAGPNCDAKWPGRDGMVRAWQLNDCSGIYLGGTASYDSDWGNSSGPFQGSDENRASSVMNSGHVGSYDIVAFYRLTNYGGGYACLKPGELYADNLSDNTFSNGDPVDNRISSHQWVDSCGHILT